MSPSETPDTQKDELMKPSPPEPFALADVEVLHQMISLQRPSPKRPKIILKLVDSCKIQSLHYTKRIRSDSLSSKASPTFSGSDQPEDDQGKIWSVASGGSLHRIEENNLSLASYNEVYL